MRCINIEGMHKMKLPLIAIAGLLAGCGSVSSVVPMGQEALMVSSYGVLGNGSAAAEKGKALQAANAHCEASGKRMEVIRVETVDPHWGKAPSAEVQFRCLAK